jgi:lipid-A-disaccharide synthase
MKAVIVIAGEVSGDIHGARLVREMKSLNPDLGFLGVGGDKLEQAGVQLLEHINHLAGMGLVEVLSHIPHMNFLLKRLLPEIKEQKVDLVILVDYPGFNLRMAKMIKNRYPTKPKIFYYISPQVWAWAPGRISSIVKYIDRMAGIIPFEIDIYKNTGLDFHFVGHPLLEEMEDTLSKDEFFRRFQLDPGKSLISLLPGSRPQEISLLLPVLAKSADIISKEVSAQFAIAASNNVPDKFYRKPTNFLVLRDETHNLQKHSDLVITASGTSTLETALAGTPMIVVYKVHPLTYAIGKMVVKLKNIALVNLVAGETVTPEFIQNSVSPQNIAETAINILKNPDLQNLQKQKFLKVKERLGTPGASRRAAELALELIG